MNQPRACGQDEATFMRALGKRVRLLRLTRDLTQDELAQATPASRARSPSSAEPRLPASSWSPVRGSPSAGPRPGGRSPSTSPRRP